MISSVMAGSSRRRIQAGAFLFGVLLPSANALADNSSNAAAAETLYRAGQALLAQDQYAEACVKLAESQRLDPAIGTLGLLALCHEKQGRSATAWQEYLEVASLARTAKQREREKAARKRAEELEKTLSRLRIDVPSPVANMEVLRNDEAVGQGQWGVAIPADPGTIKIVARAPGHETWSTEEQLSPNGASISISVPGLRPSAARQEGKQPPSQLTTSQSVGNGTGQPIASDQQSAGLQPWIRKNQLGLALTGGGVLAMGIGTFFGLRAKSKNDDSEGPCNADNMCTQEGMDLRDSAKTSATISNIGFGVGIVGVAVGVYLLTRKQPAAHPSASHVPVSPVLTLSGGATHVVVHF